MLGSSVFVLGGRRVPIPYATIAIGASLIVVILIWMVAIEIRLHSIRRRYGRMRTQFRDMQNAQSHFLMMALNARPKADRKRRSRKSNDLDVESASLLPPEETHSHGQAEGSASQLEGGVLPLSRLGARDPRSR
jgi:hypothetical protein